MRRVNKSEVEYIEDRLESLKVEIDKIKFYIEGKPWADIEPVAIREKEFKFQSDLYDKYFKWLNQYAELSGMIDFYNEHNSKKKTELREGFEDNYLQKLLSK